jgi:ArsR family transcriptional regulator
MDCFVALRAPRNDRALALIPAVQLLRIYDCLCDATRLRLLHLLSVRPLCVCHFEAVLRLPQAKISRHLAYLRQNGMVVTRQRGPWRIYSLAAPPPPVLAANLACLQDALTTDPLLRRDREVLAGLAARADCGCATPGVPRRQLLRLGRRPAASRLP